MEYVRRILVAGDEPGYSVAVLRHLKHEGFITETALSRDEAHRKIQQGDTHNTPFDLIIIYTFGSDTGGLDFLAWLKKSHPGISVILLTAYGHSDESLELLRPALDDYADLPLTPQRMLDLIDSVDRRRRCVWVHLRRNSGTVQRRS